MDERTARARARFELALALFEFSERALSQRLRRENPAITEEEIAARVGEWCMHRPGAEAGDAEGRSIPWPPRR